MTLRLLIHHTPNSFSTRWIAYCNERGIRYSVVDCLDTNIITEIASADLLLWHWHHANPSEQLVARQVIVAAEAMGVLVFPSTPTCWHFDDKLGQKYLLEAVGAPLVPTQVFYGSNKALEWLATAKFPKVFKLSKGAGSSNVRIVRNAREARDLIKRAFTHGFWPVAGYQQDAAKRYRAARQRGDLLGAIRRLPASLAKIRSTNRAMKRESGYVYFQDFVPGNAFDIRVTVIGNRAFGFTRDVRPGDFRASGSGRIVYDLERVHPDCVRIAFDVVRRVGSQSMAFDFVRDGGSRPLILEVSYAYDPHAVHNCAGYWDDQLHWHEGHKWPQDAILEDLLEEVRRHGGAHCRPDGMRG
jgi:glutathione synthase/RimK-type ligase-like ATP-grasp enzyme